MLVVFNLKVVLRSKLVLLLFFLTTAIGPTQAQVQSVNHLSKARINLSATTVGSKVFFSGGYELKSLTLPFYGAPHQEGSNIVDIFDNSINMWTVASLSEARWDLSSTSIASKVLFAGGRNSALEASNVVDIYDNNINTWTKATLSLARSGLSATSVGTKAFFAGGEDVESYRTDWGHSSDRVDIYDNNNNRWSAATLTQRGSVCATSVGNKAFFAGGYKLLGFPNCPGCGFAKIGSDVVDIYDINTNTWSTDTLSQPRYGISATSAGTKVFFAGGISFAGRDDFGFPIKALSNVVDIYDNSSDSWVKATLSKPAAYLSAACVGTKVFFASDTLIDIYDIKTGIWSMATLTQPRSRGLGSTSVGSKVFFAGGYIGSPTFQSDVVDVIDYGITQTIAFDPISDKTLGDVTFGLNAKSTSNFIVSFRSTSDKLSITGNQVTILKPGSVTIIATQPGDEIYSAAVPIAQTFCINPASPTITKSLVEPGAVILTSNSAIGNQWFLNDVEISGATNNSFAVMETGLYKLRVIVDNCASAFSDTETIVVTGDIALHSSCITIYPSPVADYLELHGTNNEVGNAQVFDMAGRLKILEFENMTSVYRVNVHHLSPGLYLLRFQDGQLVRQVKFIKN